MMDWSDHRAQRASQEHNATTCVRMSRYFVQNDVHLVTTACTAAVSYRRSPR
jgi:hypothetical protein